MQAIFAEERMSLELVAREKDCYVDLNIVAVGGGGRPGNFGGSGSGFVETLVVQINSSSPLARINVGPYILIVDGYGHAGRKILQKQYFRQNLIFSGNPTSSKNVECIFVANIVSKSYHSFYNLMKASVLECMYRTSGRVKLSGNWWEGCSRGQVR